jgi:hypothetical protein
MKPVVFISHIKEEAEIATALKELIAPHFLGLLDFFVSSDGASISMGQKWLDTVSAQLKSCAVEIVVCSPRSVVRPWINFEAGAAWIRDIPVIPLCHSGMSPSDLPVPLSLLQSAKLTDVAGMNLVVPVLANALGAASPKIDFSDFVARVKAFEERYTFWDECNGVFTTINSVHKDIIPALRTHARLEMDLPESALAALESVAPFLRKNALLDFTRIGRSSLTPNGMFYGCELLKLPKLDDLLKSPDFKPKA